MRVKFKIILPILVIMACSNGNVRTATTTEADTSKKPSSSLTYDSENGSLNLPQGFKAVVVADKLGRVRHIDVDENGVIYARLGSDVGGRGLVMLKDNNGDGIADQKEYFGTGSGTGIKVHHNYLYYSTNEQVFRKAFVKGEAIPSGEPELIVTLPRQYQHEAKSIALDKEGYLYVNIGAPSNSCQDPDRQPGVKGLDPCPLLEKSGGIWRFSANSPDQKFEDGIRYATGIRNAVGITWNTANNTLYAMQHGRDQLHSHWPELYSEKESAELPAEEMFEVQQGDDFGWPYCYYDQNRKLKLLGPEYGGNKEKTGRCADKEDPVIAFPGHWAPNALTFYNVGAFPTKYHNGAFVAFHG
ncbi:MAG: PQQ-dependent sugar dehydrogenase, partial [Owenweeksia sp.]